MSLTIGERLNYYFQWGSQASPEGGVSPDASGTYAAVRCLVDEALAKVGLPSGSGLSDSLAQRVATSVVSTATGEQPTPAAVQALENSYRDARLVESIGNLATTAIGFLALMAVATMPFGR